MLVHLMHASCCVSYQLEVGGRKQMAREDIPQKAPEIVSGESSIPSHGKRKRTGLQFGKQIL